MKPFIQTFTPRGCVHGSVQFPQVKKYTFFRGLGKGFRTRCVCRGKLYCNPLYPYSRHNILLGRLKYHCLLSHPCSSLLWIHEMPSWTDRFLMQKAHVLCMVTRTVETFREDLRKEIAKDLFTDSRLMNNAMIRNFVDDDALNKCRLSTYGQMRRLTNDHGDQN